MNIAITGSSGRMGRTLIESVLNQKDLNLRVALDHANSQALGQDAGTYIGVVTNINITSHLADLQDADCLIDFTRPEGSLQYLKACVEHKVAMVIGTTGFDAAGKQAIEQAAQQIPIVFAPNMSVGVNVTLKLLELAAQLLGNNYDIEIFEAHHKKKVDAPSGTALKMAEVIASAQHSQLDDRAVWSRHGVTGERTQNEIGFSVVRGGDIVGDHTVFFCGPGERIEITHRSSSRVTYAEGSLQAARFLKNKSHGLFTMQDVLASVNNYPVA